MFCQIKIMHKFTLCQKSSKLKNWESVIMYKFTLSQISATNILLLHTNSDVPYKNVWLWKQIFFLLRLKCDYKEPKNLYVSTSSTLRFNPFLGSLTRFLVREPRNGFQKSLLPAKKTKLVLSILQSYCKIVSIICERHYI